MENLTYEERLQTRGVVLTRPTWVAPENRKPGRVWTIRNGRATAQALEDFTMSADVRGSIVVGPGFENSSAVQMIPTIASQLERIAPWVTCYVVPSLYGRSPVVADYNQGGGRYLVDGESYDGYGGGVIEGVDEVYLAECGPTDLMENFFHEVFHVFWKSYLSGEAISVIETAVSQGIQWPTDYHNDPEECGARLFASWATAQLHGQPGDIWMETDGMNIKSIFQEIWSGETARVLVTRGVVQDADVIIKRKKWMPYTEPKTTPTKEEILIGGLLAAVKISSKMVRASWNWLADAFRTEENLSI
jgi:hypothetical protein